MRPSHTRRYACFNPRPPLLAGDAVGGAGGGHMGGVSIRARHCWRAMPPLPGAGRRRRPCFNPRPPLLAGDAAAAPAAPVAAPVSIRARHCWRAMPPGGARPRRYHPFQSAPAIAGGRCRAHAGARGRHRGFNPRPPLLAGDAPVSQRACCPQGVSIRARHCWRAMPQDAFAAAMGCKFQSAPAIAGGRCLSRSSGRSLASSFNPRPPLLAGDAPTRPRGRWAFWVFQSAPAIAGGRCPAHRRASQTPFSFNPRPPLLAGDAARPASPSTPTRCFNPRPPLLAGDARLGLTPPPKPKRFNPRPPLLAGDASAAGVVRPPSLVSIRARHCWRAMRGARGRRPQRQRVSIRARHCWRAMPTQSAATGTPLAFQSAPAIAGGRCVSSSSESLLVTGFNPRPPLLAGDACTQAQELDQGVVSIRARHCWRAMPSPPRMSRSVSVFQSAPAIAGGRCAGA